MLIQGKFPYFIQTYLSVILNIKQYFQSEIFPLKKNVKTGYETENDWLSKKLPHKYSTIFLPILDYSDS
jgi:hypothetical protein